MITNNVIKVESDSAYGRILVVEKAGVKDIKKLGCKESFSAVHHRASF
jgi:hypothetical protein